MTNRLLDTLEQEKYNYDESCKKILCEVQIMAYILKECVEEFERFSRKEIEQLLKQEIIIMNGEEISVNGARIYYDVFFEVKGEKLLIDVEPQNREPGTYPLLTRAMYYGIRMLDRQIGGRYASFKKVYSIWILFNPTGNKGNVINTYSMNEKSKLKEYQASKKDYDLVQIVMIHLPKKGQKGKSPMMELLKDIFVENYSPKHIKDILVNKYGIILTEGLDQEVDRMCNWSEGVYENGKLEGRKEGRKEGRLEGQKEGISAGIQQSTLNHVQKIMKKFSLNETEALDVLEVEGELRAKVLEKIKSFKN